MTISRRLRFEILARDSHTCRYCGRAAPEVALQVDHVIPVALGGSDEPANLATACADCNGGKSSVGPTAATVDAVSLDAKRWTQAITDAAAARRDSRAELQKARNLFEQRWGGRRLPEDWGASVDRFVQMGLTATDVEFYAERAGENGRSPDHAWRWFCKVMWSEVKRITADAASALGGEPAGSDAPSPVVQIHFGDPEPMCIECDDRPALESGWSIAGAEGLCEQCRGLRFEGLA